MKKSILKPGDRFGKLTILSEASPVNGKRMYRYECECGVIKIGDSYKLRNGEMKTCGSAKCKVERLSPGEVFGRWVVISDSEIETTLCECGCGSRKEVLRATLRKGTSRSCGCLQKEVAALQGAKTARHGMSETKEYRTWRSMRNRCKLPTVHNYQSYGGRGVQVCERWEIFENFFSDIGEIPEGLTLDRIDVNSGYSPDNCRLATPKQQANNKRNNVVLSINGFTGTVSQISDMYCIDASLLRNRLRRGWCPEKAVMALIGGKQCETEHADVWDGLI